MANNISVAYLNFLDKTFISAITIEHEYLRLLSEYVLVSIVDVGPSERYIEKLNKIDYDYLFVDVKHFNCGPFILREKGELSASFIIMLHSTFAWAETLVYALPLIRKDDIVIAPSEYAKDSFLRIARKCKVEVIPHCLDIKSIQNGVLGLKNKSNRKVISYMGCLVENKGLDVLIKCLPGIIKKCGEVNLNIVGPLSGANMDNNPSPYYIKLKQLVNKLKLNRFVEFKGLQLGIDKYRILAQSNVFVNPSLILSETFGMVNIEALACGVPIVCTKCDGFKGIIKNNKNGFFIDLDHDENNRPRINERQLSAFIVKILKDPDLNRRMKLRALRDALRYDYRLIMPKLIRLLKKPKGKRTRGKWDLVKDKKIIDFPHFYKKEMLPFIRDLGWGNQTYAMVDKMKSWDKTYEDLYRYLTR